MDNKNWTGKSINCDFNCYGTSLLADVRYR
jgi:hypothetical protein